MIASIVRTLLFTLVLVALIVKARQAPSRSRRKRAFLLGAVALAILVAINVMHIMGIPTDLYLIPALTVISTLLFITALLLYQAWRAGEMHEQIEQVQQALEDERNRRNKR